MENFIFVMSSTNASQIPVGVLLPSVYATTDITGETNFQFFLKGYHTQYFTHDEIHFLKRTANNLLRE